MTSALSGHILSPYACLCARHHSRVACKRRAHIQIHVYVDPTSCKKGRANIPRFADVNQGSTELFLQGEVLKQEENRRYELTIEWDATERPLLPEIGSWLRRFWRASPSLHRARSLKSAGSGVVHVNPQRFRRRWIVEVFLSIPSRTRDTCKRISYRSSLYAGLRLNLR